ncbi:hypothetical protein T261_0870 [Streptomyces lydicus]|nr:hypothetical protein T261_0870 [Streptomyces lydicus]
MQVDIFVEPAAEGGSDDRALTSLYRWLARDPDTAGHTTISLAPGAPGAGDMGGAFEVINAVVANAIALGGLAVACATWRDARPGAPVVRIERDGVTVTVEDGSPETVSRIVAALGQPPPGSQPPQSAQGGAGGPDGGGDAPDGAARGAGPNRPSP